VQQRVHGSAPSAFIGPPGAPLNARVGLPANPLPRARRSGVSCRGEGNPPRPVPLDGEPRDILLTNRHHYRHCAELEQAFGCTVWCNREGLHEFQAGEQVRGFTVGDVLPGNIESYEVGALCPDETALRVPVAEGALAIADGVVRDGDGPLVFVPDFLIGEDPEGVKAGLRTVYQRLADALEFDHLLLAHGEPWIGGAREALRRFAAGEEP
jgi:hypothetical protein